MFILSAIRSFGRSSPLTVALLLLVAVLTVIAYSLLANGAIDVTDTSGQVKISYVVDSVYIEATAASLILTMIWLLGWGKSTYLTTRTDKAGLPWAMIAFTVPTSLTVLFAGLVLLQGNDPDQAGMIFKLILFCIAVGIFEETLFRGAVFHGLSRHLSPFWAMIISSALFGLFHMQNIMVGQDIAGTMFQSLNAFALGIVFCAVMLQTNSIWWAIGLHAIWNAFLFISAYIVQQQPTLMNLSADEIAVTRDTAEITGSAFGLPLFLFLFGIVIYSRWAKRAPYRDATV